MLAALLLVPLDGLWYAGSRAFAADPLVADAVLTTNVPVSTAQKRQALQMYLNSYAPYSSSKMLTMGVELEGSFPGLSRDEAYEKMIALMSNKISSDIAPGKKLVIENYDFSTRRGEPRKGTKFIIRSEKGGTDVIWQLKDDGSIHPAPGNFGVELVTPILRTRKDVQDLKDVIQLLARAGFKSEEDSAALQAHVGFSESGPLSKEGTTSTSKIAEALMMVWVFSKIEKQMMTLFKVHPGRQKYTMPTPELLIADIEAAKIDMNGANLNAIVEKYYNYRYWALNMYSLFQFGTVEVRFANSTTDKEKIDAFIDFSAKIVRAVRTKNPKLIALMNKYIDDEIPLEELAQAFDLKIKKMLSQNDSCTSKIQ
jgi:hypothetical protein